MFKILDANIRVKTDNGHIRFLTLNDIDPKSIKLKEKEEKPKAEKPKKK